MATRFAARILRPTPRNIALVAAWLRRGEIAGVPSETVYGLAGNALDASACAKIFAAKRRPANDPLIVHVFSAEQLEGVCVLNVAARQLAAAFWPGPLTMVLPKRTAVPSIVTSGRESVAVRMPSHPVFRRLLKQVALPLAAPSANPFGYISPTTAKHVRDGLGAEIKYILDGGPAGVGLESTIVDLREPHRPTVLRPGGVTIEELERVLRRKVAVFRRHRASTRTAQLAPGLLARHYSPHTPVALFPNGTLRATANLREAFVFMRKPAGAAATNSYWLDPRGNIAGVARRLFALMRTLDKKGLDRINIERAPEGGLGAAINDRLERAAAN